MKKVDKMIIKVPIYNVDVDIRLGDFMNLKEEIQKDYKIQLNESDQTLSNAGGLTFNLEKDYGIGGTILIGLHQFWNCQFSYSLSIMCHEFIHAANMLIGNRGMTCDETNDENLAYITGYLFNAFLQRIEIDRLQKKERKKKNDEKV